jgi:hypothetical protein
MLWESLWPVFLGVIIPHIVADYCHNFANIQQFLYWIIDFLTPLFCIITASESVQVYFAAWCHSMQDIIFAFLWLWWCSHIFFHIFIELDLWPVIYVCPAILWSIYHWCAAIYHVFYIFETELVGYFVSNNVVSMNFCCNSLHISVIVPRLLCRNHYTAIWNQSSA